jgi:hypothetical protein
MIVLGIGAGLVISGLFMLIKSCTRPRKRAHPVPSRPVLQEAYCDPFIEDSPLFGGLERLSAVEKNDYESKDNKPMQWTQYRCPSLPPMTQPENVLSVPHASTMEGSNDNLHVMQRELTNQMLTSTAQEAILSKKMAENHCISRLSAGSISIYPGTPNSAQMAIALGGEAAFKAQILSPDPRALKSPKSPLVKSSTFAGHPIQKLKKSRPVSEAYAYDGADILSPKLTQESLSTVIRATDIAAPSSSAQMGRTRIRSTYFEKYPRGSSIHISNSVQSSKPIREGLNAIPQRPNVQPPFLATTRCSEHDVHTLTQAMGLSSPTITAMPPSPQTTIYPDDSMSVAHRSVKPTDSTRMKSNRKAVPKRTDTKHRHARDTQGANASALGEFMLADDTTGSSFSAGMHSPEPIIEHVSSHLVTIARPTMVTVGNNGSSGGKDGNPNARKKTAVTRGAGNDVPPRVPSPPVLPSLAQMAMEQANPEAYEDYRSPTYSLYGLYQDRKSQMYAPGGH